MEFIMLANKSVCQALLNQMPKNGRILDAGCGDFTYTNFVDHFNKNIVSLEINNLNISSSKEKSFILGTIEKLPFKDNSFDFIFCLSVLEFLIDHSRALSEFNRILKSGGELLFTVPTKMSIFKILREIDLKSGLYKHPHYNVPHYHYYTINDIKNLASDKFKIITISGYQYNFLPVLVELILRLAKLNILIIFIKNKLLSNAGVNAYHSMKKCTTNYQNHISNRSGISNLSYHYIVVFRKA